MLFKTFFYLKSSDSKEFELKNKNNSLAFMHDLKDLNNFIMTTQG